MVSGQLVRWIRFSIDRAAQIFPELTSSHKIRSLSQFHCLLWFQSSLKIQYMRFPPIESEQTISRKILSDFPAVWRVWMESRVQVSSEQISHIRNSGFLFWNNCFYIWTKVRKNVLEIVQIWNATVDVNVKYSFYVNGGTFSISITWFNLGRSRARAMLWELEYCTNEWKDEPSLLSESWFPVTRKLVDYQWRWGDLGTASSGSTIILIIRLMDSLPGELSRPRHQPDFPIYIYLTFFFCLSNCVYL